MNRSQTIVRKSRRESVSRQKQQSRSAQPKIKKTSEKIYKDLSLKGICRIDYILDGKIPYVIEVNTIPGFTEKSIIPQQNKNEGFTLEEIFSMSLEK